MCVLFFLCNVQCMVKAYTFYPDTVFCLPICHDNGIVPDFTALHPTVLLPTRRVLPHCDRYMTTPTIKYTFIYSGYLIDANALG